MINHQLSVISHQSSSYQILWPPMGAPPTGSGTGREADVCATRGYATVPWLPFGLTVHGALRLANSRMCCPSSLSACGISDCAARLEFQIDFPTYAIQALNSKSKDKTLPSLIRLGRVCPWICLRLAFASGINARGYKKQ